MKLVKAVLAATIAFSSLLALAQAPASAPPQAAPAPSGRTIHLEPKPLPAATPVITLQGLCAGKPAGTAGCATVVTRAEIQMLKTIVHQADPKAFMVIGAAHEALGEGFQPFKKQ